jgi:hypothetical protein
VKKTIPCIAGLLAATLMCPALATPWKPVAKGDGYVSPGVGTIRASQAPQPPRRVLEVAKAFAGIPYVWAGHDPTKGFDCSGYVYEVLRLNGYSVPRMADAQFDETTRVPYDKLQPGDLVFFRTYLPGPSHVGFYIGKGEFIHASSAAEGVVVSQMTSGYYRERFLGGGRPEGWKDDSLRVADAARPAVEVSEVAAMDAMEEVANAPAEVQQAAGKSDQTGVAAASDEADAAAARDEGAVAAVSDEAGVVADSDEAGVAFDSDEAGASGRGEGAEVADFSPFLRNRGPQPVRVSVVPDDDEEAIMAEWSLILGETVAVAELQAQSLARAFHMALGGDIE